MDVRINGTTATDQETPETTPNAEDIAANEAHEWEQLVEHYQISLRVFSFLLNKQTQDGEVQEMLMEELHRATEIMTRAIEGLMDMGKVKALA